MSLSAWGHLVEGKEVARVVIRAIQREGINFVARVDATHATRGIASCSIAASDNDITVEGRTLALHAHEFRPEIEDEIASLVAKGVPDTDP
jgi:hypothetical protein